MASRPVTSTAGGMRFKSAPATSSALARYAVLRMYDLRSKLFDCPESIRSDLGVFSGSNVILSVLSVYGPDIFVHWSVYVFLVVVPSGRWTLPVPRLSGFNPQVDLFGLAIEGTVQCGSKLR